MGEWKQLNSEVEGQRTISRIAQRIDELSDICCDNVVLSESSESARVAIDRLGTAYLFAKASIRDQLSSQTLCTAA